jgi:hypothetical protein
MSISVSPENPSRTAAEFSLAFENTADADFVLNLGSMLANGKVMFPAVREDALTVTARGRSEERRGTGACRRGDQRVV